MELSDPEAFLQAFGEYCFGTGEKLNERQRLGRKFAWYEMHLVNVLADFVESGAARAVLPDDNGEANWVAAREQRNVDVALCPPEFQKRQPLMNEQEPHSPLYDLQAEEWRDHVTTIETKIIPDANWASIWRDSPSSAFADLRGKDGKPTCDYLLACIHSFLPKRRVKQEWFREACEAFKAREPGAALKLMMAAKGQEEVQIQGGPKIRYIARWPSAPDTIRVPCPTPKWGDKEWLGSVSDIFLVLLARD